MPRYIDADKMIADTKAMKQIADGIEIDGIVKYIEEHSTAAVAEVKHGEWIDLHDENVLYEQTYKCSACGEWFVIEAGTPKENGYKYCPNCGARMDGEE